MAIALLVTQAGGVHAGPADAFRQHYEKALRLYQEGDLDESLKEFKAAYALRQLPRLLINIARIYRKLGHPREAMEFYDLYRKMEPDPPAEIRTGVETETEQIRRALQATEGVIAGPPKPAPVAGKGEGVRVLDLTVPVPAAPAAHRVAAGKRAARPLYKSWWPWTLAAVATAGIVSAIVATTYPREPRRCPFSPNGDC